MITRPQFVPGSGAGALAILSVAVADSLFIAVACGLLQVWPFVLIVTLFIATFVGLPLFATVRRVRRRQLAIVLIAGFVAGAFAPLLLTSLGPHADQASVGNTITIADGSYTTAGWLQMLGIAGDFGLTGAVSALIAWRLSIWVSLGATNLRRMAVALASAAVAASSFAVPTLYVDRSCHNPLRDGRSSIGPVAGFDLRVPPRDWRALSDEVHGFAAEIAWQERHDVRPDGGFLWYQQSLCTAAGSLISIDAGAPNTAWLTVSAFAPQGGKAWQRPLNALQRRIQARWPNAVQFSTNPYASPRPPWAQAAPTPTPSAAAR